MNKHRRAAIIAAVVSRGGGAAPLLSSLLSTQPWAVWGFEQFQTDYASPAIRLRRASDDAESDFDFLANGQLDYAAIATWAGGASFVDTLYDLSGNGRHLTQATNARQPGFNPTGIGGKAAADFVAASTNYMEFSADITTSNGKAFSVVYHPDGAAGTDQRLIHALSEAPAGNKIVAHLIDAAGRTGYFDTAWRNIAAATSVAQGMIWNLVAGGNGTLYRSGVSIGETTYTDGAMSHSSTTHKVGCNAFASSSWYDGLMSSMMIFDASIDAGNISAISNYMETSWGL